MKNKKEPSSYTLNGAPLIHAPGIYRWAKNGYRTEKTKSGKAYFIDLIKVGWNLAPDITEAAFKDEIPVIITDDAVTITDNR